MSLQNISRDILSKAKSQAELIDSQTKKEMSSLKVEFESNFENYKESLVSKYDEEFNIAKTKIESKYNGEAKEIVLNTKAKILSQVTSQSISDIHDISKKDREKILSTLIREAKNHIDFDKVYTLKDDIDFVKSKVNNNIKVIQAKDYGLIFEAKNGKERLGLSFKTLFEDLFSRNEDKVQRI